MKINRHNYEEFFILYWDNELDPSQKKMVEKFVVENPDIADEFNLLGEIRYTKDEKIIFDKKEFLLSDMRNSIHKGNYQEFLISYTDNELDDDKRVEVEKFTTAHPAAKKELDLFLKTKLQPDTDIIFPDKSILYRRTGRVRILRPTWMRIAAAAVLLLIGGILLLQLLNTGKNVSDQNIAINNKTETKQELQIPITDTPKAIESQVTENPGINIENSPASSTNEIRLAQTVAEEKKDQLNTRVQNLSDENSGEPVFVKNEISTENPSTETAAIQPRQLIRQAMETEDVQRKSLILGDNSVTEKMTPTYAVYTPPDESDDSGGFKELLRKATRVFERRTKIQATTEDNKLLVGAFAVSLK